MLRLVREKAPHYGPLIRDDLHNFRDEIVKATIGAGVAAVAGLIFACFLSEALIISAWDSGFRIATTSVICAFWALLAILGLWYARWATSGPAPFRLMAAALARDQAGLLALIDEGGSDA